MIVNFKKLDSAAVSPRKTYETDAGFDFVATSIHHNLEHAYVEYGTSVAVQIPPGYVGLMFPRSSICNVDLILANSVGVWDANFSGEVKFRFRAGGENLYKVGDRIGQMVIMPIPEVSLHEVGELRPSERGDRGWGSSGR